MAFFDVHFSYIDQATLEGKFVNAPDQGGDKLIPEGALKPGVLHTISQGLKGHWGLFRIETQMTAGNGQTEPVRFWER